jgi:hypothetical protein
MKAHESQGLTRCIKLKIFEESGKNREETQKRKRLKYDGESKNPWEKK